MIDPTDDLATRFDGLNEMAAQRGWSPSRHPHPTRYGETLRIERLEASVRDETRLSAVRAVIGLKPVAEKDRCVWVRIEACFRTGRYEIAYFDGQGDMTESYGGNVAFHKLYLERRDARQALNTGYEMLLLGCLVRVLRASDRPGDGERLEGLRAAMRGELPDGADVSEVPFFPMSFKLDL